MIRRGLFVATFVIAGSAAVADDRAWRDLDAALSVAAAGEDLSAAGPTLARLEAAHRRQQAQFDAAARRPLPAVAQARLARTRAAYEAGQGRLLHILRDLVRAPQAERAALLEEARGIAARLREAPGPEPLSADVRPRVRAPRLAAPGLPAAAEGRDADTAADAAAADAAAGTPETAPAASRAATSALLDVAAGLAGPVQAYEWVRNTVRPELYHGAMKGPEQTWREGGGNDVDTASLLIAVLRAKGIMARYVRGTADVPAASLVALTGTRTPEQAVRVLERAGIPHEPVLGGAGVGAVRMERTWVEAHVPYANYRGAVLDPHGKVWVPLDPGYKPLAPPSGIDAVGALGLDPDALLDDYLAQPPGAPPLDALRQRIGTLLAEQRPGTPVDDVPNRRHFDAQVLGILPASLPYPSSVAERSFAVPETLQHGVRVLAAHDTRTVLDWSAALPDVLGRRLTVAWLPATDEDAEVVALYGGLMRTPPYLVEVRPVVRVDGVSVADGDAGIGMGVPYTLRVEVRAPGGAEDFSNRLLAGNLLALGFGGRGSAGEESADDQAAALLAARAWSYLASWNAADEQMADLLRVLPIRPIASGCLVSSAVDVDYAGGDPSLPLHFTWKGLTIDADLRASAPVALDGPANERALLLLSGLEGSVLENRVFEDGLSLEAVSTAKALQLAAQAGIPVVAIDSGNAHAVLPGLGLDPQVAAEIAEAVAAGLVARVPAQPVTHLAWTGVGYLLLDQTSGASAWQLQGGHSGGVTAPAVIDIPAEIADPFAEPSDEPSPGDTPVVRLRRLPSTDFQEGVVDKPLARTLKVLATDADGFAVENAPVTFQVVGGGATLEHPATGERSTGELAVLSDRSGHAEIRLILGQRTDLIPRFVTLEGDENPTQVGLNLVTARSGRAALDGAFTAFGYPDERREGDLIHFQWQWTAWHTWPGFRNLRVGGLLRLRIDDQHGNPLSNVGFTFRYKPDPEQIDLTGTGWYHLHEPTATPGRLLTTGRFTACLETTPDPVYGECAGEAQAVEVRSTPSGLSAYTVLGDSPGSYYTFTLSTSTEADFSTVWHVTNEWVCRSPDPLRCMGNPRRPDPAWVEQGPRTVRVNRLGNLVEAYPPGGAAPVEVYATALYEEAVAQPFTHQGQEHFRAVGLNRWTRRRLDNSEFTLRPVSDGTEVSSSAFLIGDGAYGASMVMGPAPQLNVIEIEGRHRADVIPYLEPLGNPNSDMPVDPQYVDPATGEIQRVPAAEPLVEKSRFALWGAAPRLLGFDPDPVRLSSTGLVTERSLVGHQILPVEYAQELEPVQVLFAVSRGSDVVAAANGAEGPAFTIPVGLALPVQSPHTAQLSVLGVGSAGEPLTSPPLAIPACYVGLLETRRVVVGITRDPLNAVSCAEDGKLRFVLCRDAAVTLTIDGGPLVGVLRRVGETLPPGSPPPAPIGVQAVPLAAGQYEVLVPPSYAPQLREEEAFQFVATALEDPSLEERDAGVIVAGVRNRSALPIGHTFVQGVDLFDGHLVHSVTDLVVPGRHLGLSFTRTYSSAGGESDEGAMGAGWQWSYHGRLTPMRCGLVRVDTGSQSQVFREGPDGSFAPQKGHHGTLRRDEAEDTYEFVDKAGNVYRFGAPESEIDTQSPRRLESIEEPHGDRIVLTYDAAGRVAKVAEVHPERGAVRTLDLHYANRGGHDRIVRAEILALALRLDFGHDQRGNLVTATRNGANLLGRPAAPVTYGYDYSASSSRDRHQMTASRDPNGARTEYVYFAPGETFPGESPGTLVQDKEEYVKLVREFPGGGQPPVETAFAYDLATVASARWVSFVTDARASRTRYEMNGDGAVLEVREAVGTGVERATVLEWAPDDILKVKEVDALLRVRRFEHDAQGNLTLERLLSPDEGTVLAETKWEYDPRFSKLTFKEDAEGRQTHYFLDDRGDVVRMTDPVGNETVYTYDGAGHGLLLKVRDPRGYETAHSAHDDFGRAWRTDDPLGNVTQRAFDRRGRLLRESDSLGRLRTQTWDGLDRPDSTTRFAGPVPAGAPRSNDEKTSTKYHPGGQPHIVTSANGAVTTFTLDGMNRVVTEDVSLPDGTTYRRQIGYDGNGNKVEETDRRGVTKAFSYDALNRLTSVQIASGLAGEGPTGQIASYTYDLAGNRLTETDLAGLTTSLAYDGLYRVKTTTFPEGDPAYTEHQVWDRVGNRLSFTSRNGHTTAFEYDGLSRLIKTTNALGQVATVTYADPEGSKVNKAQEHDQTRGLRTAYAYDPLSRETSRTVHLEGEDGDPASGTVTYTTATAYFDADHAVEVTDARGTVVRSELNGLDREVRRTVDVGGLNLTTTTRYDGAGNKVSVTDPRGHATRSAYDGLSRLLSTTDARQKTTSFTYDGEGNRLSQTDRRGVTILHTYDNLTRPRTGRLAAAPFSGIAWGRTTEYLDTQRKRRETDERGHTTVLDLDGLDRVTKVTDPQGRSTLTQWDGLNRRRETDERGNATTFEYDALSRLTKTTDPIPFGAQTVETTYEDALNRVTEKKKSGALKVTQADPLGRVLTVTEDGILRERNAYDALGNKTAGLDGDGHETRFAYDPANRLASRTDGFGTPAASTTEYGYDAAGNLTAEIDARSSESLPSMRYTYDELNRRTSETDANGNATRYDYDPEGNRTLVREADGQETTYAYNERGKILGVTQPGGLVTSYVYDAADNLVRQTDAGGHVVETAYDELNRVVSMVEDPGGLDLTTTRAYDEAGNETVVTSPSGHVTTSTYDALNRLKTRSYAYAAAVPERPWRHTVSIGYAYDADGNLAQVDESLASGTDLPSLTVTTSRAYDGLDRLISETVTLPGVGTRTVGFTYHASGSRKTITEPGGAANSYVYDGQNRLQSATTDFDTPAAKTTTYTYLPDSLLHEVSHPNGVTVTHAYDPADRLLSITSTLGGEVVSRYAYTYDARGNRLSQVEVHGSESETTTYSYDDLSRLSTVTYPPDETYPEGRRVEYGYDAVGNQVSEVVKHPATDAVLASTAGVFDAANRQLELTDHLDPSRTTTFTYDLSSNLTSKTQDGVTTAYVYDCRDKLVEVQQGASIPGRYAYDFAGLLRTSIDDQGVRSYVHDDGTILAEYNEAGLQAARYDYGDRLLRMTLLGEGERYVSLDALGSPTSLTDELGVPKLSLHLDANGLFRNPSELDTTGSRMAFTGYRFSRSTGLYYARARWYVPELRRFLTADTFLGDPSDPPSLHRFGYAHANPTRYIDPTGHQAAPANEAMSYEEARQLYRDSTATLAALGSAQRPSLWQRVKDGFSNAVRRVQGLVITEDGPSTGDPTDTPNSQAAINSISDPIERIAAIEASKQRTLETVAKGAQIATDASQAVIAATAASDIAVLTTGRDLNEQDSSRWWAAAGLGTAGTIGLVAKFGDRLPLIGRLFRRGDEAANRAARTDYPTHGGEFLDDGVRNAAPSRGACFGEACGTNYRGAFFEANPELQGEVVVHHAVEQQALKRFPNAVSESEIHSLENLRGIPKAVNSDVHLSRIRKEWNQFYRQNPNPTKEQLLAKATDIDRRYGAQFTPPVRYE